MRPHALTDITHPFLAAAAAIPAGELVRAPSLHMLDAMNALTILDPRMDTGCRPVGGKPRQSGGGAEVRADEVCAVVDRLVVNEMAFHSGWPLVPTVFTSLHYIHLPTLRLSQGPVHPLLPYLEAYNLSLAYAWSELVKGATYDGEDYMSDVAGMWVEGEEWDVHGAEEVVAGLEEAMVAVRGLDVDPQTKQQLLLRLQIRQHFLALLSWTISGEPNTCLAPAGETERLVGLLEFDPELTSTTAPFFDPSIPRRFRQAMPVPTVRFPSAGEAYAHLLRVMDGLRLVCEVREREPGRESGAQGVELEVRERQGWGFALGDGVACWNPVVRSCMTWSIVDGFVYPLEQGALVSQWVAGYTAGPGREFDVDRVLYRASAEDWERLVEVRRFFDVLGENIRLDLHDRCQNRARQHRLSTVSAQRWADLHPLLPPPGVLDPGEHTLFAQAIAARRGDALLDALLTGLDLDLVESAEWESMYWFIWRVAGERAACGGKGTWCTLWARAWAAAAKGVFLTLSGPRRGATGTNALAKAVFDHRFAPFQARSESRRSGAGFSSWSYDDYMQSQAAVREMPAENMRSEIESSFKSASEAFSEVRQRLEATEIEQGEQQRRLADTHKRICDHLRRRIDTYISKDPEDYEPDENMRWSKWLPPVRDIRGAMQTGER